MLTHIVLMLSICSYICINDDIDFECRTKHLRVSEMAWDVLSGVTKTAWDVLSGLANLCGMFCPGCPKNGMGCFVAGCFVRLP